MITDQVHSDPLCLQELACVQSGYLSRQAVSSNPSGTHWLLQAKDVTPGQGVELEDAARFHPQRNPELYGVSRGDILIAARGQDHRPCLIIDELHDVLASNVFYIIRSDGGRVIPEYLAWWLSLPSVQAKIDAGSRGTGIGYVSRQFIEQLSVVVPTMEVQSKIASVMGLWHRRQDLQSQLNLKHEQLIQAACRSVVTGTIR